MERVVRRNTSVQVPVENVITWIGFAPKPSFRAFHPSRARGTRQAIKTTALTHINFFMARSEIFLQVHSGVKLRHLICVAIEFQRGALAKFAETPFGRLA